jgi:NitT/TauT family transport system ATP-binding protein
MTREVSVPAVEIQSVSKQYGDGNAVLRDISLKVLKGEFVGIIGPSGCGKSTVLKLISGLVVPSSGTIRVDGMIPKNARETVSYIFQDATLLPWRTVRHNVGLALELEGASSDRRKAKTDALLDVVGLRSVADAYPRELSGGMKMRVSIARALATNPRLLLMDEPFAALDEMSRDRLNEEILRLREEQKWTAIFVTHSVVEAIFLSTRIVVLASNPGRIFAEIVVDLPPARTSTLRSTPEFEALVAKVSHTLRGARSQ